MKKRMIGVVLAVLVIGAYQAVAWDVAKQSINKLSTATIDNPSDTNITISSQWVTLSSNVLIKGKATILGSISVSATNMIAGTSIAAINGAAITNLTAANINAVKLTGTVTNKSSLCTNYTFYVSGIAASNVYVGP